MDKTKNTEATSEGVTFRVTRQVLDSDGAPIYLGKVAAETLEDAATVAAGRWGIYGGIVVTPVVTVDAAAGAMRAACDEYNAAHRAGADAATLDALRLAHQDARAAWLRARAAAGCGQSAALVAIGAAR